MLDRRNVATLIVTLVIRYGILDMGLTEEVHVLIRRPTNRFQTRTHHLELIFALLSACQPRKFTDFQKQPFPHLNENGANGMSPFRSYFVSNGL